MAIDHVKPGSNNLHQAGILPPWLWFWLVIYILKLPGLIQFLWEGNIKPVLSPQPLPEHLGGNSIALLLSLPSIHEIIPLVMLFLGVLSILFPQLRKMRVEKCYKLTQPKTITPALKEILEIVQIYAPGVEIKTNLLRGDMFAFVYPTGYRTSAIAIFAGLVKLWRSDKKAAKAMLLHELGHCRHGDVLMIGVGSFFEDLLNYWFHLLALFFVIPLILVYGWSLINSLQEHWDLHQQFSQMNSQLRELKIQMPESGNWFLAWLWFQIKQFFSVALPGTISMVVSLIFLTPVVIAAPLMATWCAEFNADQFVIAIQQSPDNLLFGLDKLSPSTSRWKWLLSRLSHPPNKLRRWMACRSMMPKQLLFLFLLFPLSYIAQLLFLLIRADVALLGMYGVGEVLQRSVYYTALGLQTAAPVWLGAGVILLLYPKIGVAWEKLFCQENDTINPPFYKEYFVSAVVLGCLAAIGYSCSWFVH
ncbi:M48 family metalloprotease [Microcoleus sp. N9_B4]|uniref:M48 family metalloprotease n=1 Tax=Microcoleus sp. N9_B4 TaxID=3055386 RepID=UPI002FD03949